VGVAVLVTKEIPLLDQVAVLVAVVVALCNTAIQDILAQLVAAVVAGKH
jgi:hypothetical protein